jgi:hypothetical protein
MWHSSWAIRAAKQQEYGTESKRTRTGALERDVSSVVDGVTSRTNAAVSQCVAAAQSNTEQAITDAT